MASTDVRTVRCLIAGRVQGVWYRAATRQEAVRLGLDGWAKNLRDGRVEVVAAGPHTAVTQLCRWLWSGSPEAVVDCVTIEEWDEPVPAGFLVR